MVVAQKRLLAKVVDQAAEQDPERLFAVIPKGPELNDGVQNLTVKGMAKGVDSLCHWIENIVGQSSPRQVLAYMGSNDVRYIFFLLACQKTGHEV